jgi:hypothetical protein
VFGSDSCFCYCNCCNSVIFVGGGEEFLLVDLCVLEAFWKAIANVNMTDVGGVVEKAISSVWSEAHSSRRPDLFCHH